MPAHNLLVLFYWIVLCFYEETIKGSSKKWVLLHFEIFGNFFVPPLIRVVTKQELITWSTARRDGKKISKINQTKLGRVSLGRFEIKNRFDSTNFNH